MKTIDLPKISLQNFNTNDAQAFEILRKVSREIGTFYLVDHGIDLKLIKELFKLSKEFFALPKVQKEAISMIHSPQFRGYSSEGGEYTDGGKDYREQLDIGTARKPFKWDLNSPLWQRLEGENLFPKELPELKNIFEEYQRQSNKACLKLLRAFARALELPSTAFDELYGLNSYEHYKIIHYPAANAVKGSTQGVGAHKDGGLLTFVLQDKQSGLEGFVNGKWFEVPPLEGSVVVNIGEFLEMATNGYLKATIHRVSLTQKERFSIAYFLGVQLDKEIPIFRLKDEFAKEAKGVDTDPKNPLLRNVAENYFKRMLRSHPDVAKAHHSDLLDRFNFTKEVVNA
nr:isopenicillin N synthase family oxygenase [Campylobacter sp. MIT 19-121]